MNKLGLITITVIADCSGVILSMLVYFLLMRKPLVDRGKMDETDRLVELQMPRFAAIPP